MKKTITINFETDSDIGTLKRGVTCWQGDYDGADGGDPMGMGYTELEALESLLNDLDIDDLRVEESTPYEQTAEYKLRAIRNIVKHSIEMEADQDSKLDKAICRAVGFAEIAQLMGVEVKSLDAEEAAA